MLNNGSNLNVSTKTKPFKSFRSSIKNGESSIFDISTIRQTKQAVDEENLEIRKIEKVISLIKEKNKRVVIYLIHQK